MREAKLQEVTLYHIYREADYNIIKNYNLFSTKNLEGGPYNIQFNRLTKKIYLIDCPSVVIILFILYDNYASKPNYVFCSYELFLFIPNNKSHDRDITTIFPCLQPANSNNYILLISRVLSA